METANNTTFVSAQTKIKVPEKNIGHDKLLQALYFFWDGFERATMNFFLIKDTAKQVIAGKDLSGDKLTLGIRRLEWQGGQARIFKDFMEHENMKPTSKSLNCLVFTYHDTPVYLYLYEDNPCLMGLDIVFYQNETFNIPNPFKLFEEKYDN